MTRRSWTDLYVGLDWHPYGRTRQEGVDCWGLYRMILQEQADQVLPLYDTVPRTDFEKTIAGETSVAPWRKVGFEERMPFDLVVMRTEVKDAFGRRRIASAHVGCVTDRGDIIHVQQGGTAVLQRFEALRMRIVEILRLRELDHA